MNSTSSFRRRAPSTSPDFQLRPARPSIPASNSSGNLSPANQGPSNTDSVNRKLGTVLENNYLWIKGKQTFNIGLNIGERIRTITNARIVRAISISATTPTADPNNTANNNLSTTGNSFASFLLGTWTAQPHRYD